MKSLLQTCHIGGTAVTKCLRGASVFIINSFRMIRRSEYLNNLFFYFLSVPIIYQETYFLFIGKSFLLFLVLLKLYPYFYTFSFCLVHCCNVQRVKDCLPHRIPILFFRRYHGPRIGGEETSPVMLIIFSGY